MYAISKNHLHGLNPLFIGEVSSTARPRRPRAIWLLSQSPLHRGGLFNTICTPSVIFIYIVSIPSSSGRSLHPHGLDAREPYVCCLNPLFIGEVSSTARPRRPRAIWLLSQSPLHRGGLFNIK